MSTQQELLELLGDRKLSINALAEEYKRYHHEMRLFDISSAILPLISSGELLYDTEGKVRKCTD